MIGAVVVYVLGRLVFFQRTVLLAVPVYEILNYGYSDMICTFLLSHFHFMDVGSDFVDVGVARPSCSIVTGCQQVNRYIHCCVRTGCQSYDCVCGPTIM